MNGGTSSFDLRLKSESTFKNRRFMSPVINRPMENILRIPRKVTLLFTQPRQLILFLFSRSPFRVVFAPRRAVSSSSVARIRDLFRGINCFIVLLLGSSSSPLFACYPAPSHTIITLRKKFIHKNRRDCSHVCCAHPLPLRPREQNSFFSLFRAQKEDEK